MEGTQSGKKKIIALAISTTIIYQNVNKFYVNRDTHTSPLFIYLNISYNY